MQYQHLNAGELGVGDVEGGAPLAGRKILVTRAAHQASRLTQMLECAGARVIELPLIEILPPVSWEAFDKVFAQVQNYNWLLFASANAVEFTVTRLKETGLLAGIKSHLAAQQPEDVRSQLSAAAVGELTASAAQEHGFKVSFQPAQFTGAQFVQQFPGYPDLSSLKMIWPRTDKGPKTVADELQNVGAQVDTVICYRTALPKNKVEVSKKLAAMFRNNAVDVITLNSAQTVRNFFELLKLGLDSLGAEVRRLDGRGAGSRNFANLAALLAPVTIASIGPETSAAAKQLLGRIDIEAKVHSIDGLVDELTCSLGTG